MPRRTHPERPFVTALGRAIRELRVERKLSQDVLGQRAGIHPTWISQIETGRVNPTFANLALISRGLEMRLSEVILLAEELKR
jgi:transcriptional regulator with XRE-family HTH domain